MILFLRLLVLVIGVSVTHPYNTTGSDDRLINLYGPTRETTTERDHGYNNPDVQTQNDHVRFQIDKEIIDSIFERPLNPDKGQARTLQRTITAEPTVTTTVKPIVDKQKCQCVPYNLCDSNYVGIHVNDPAITGVGLIQIRFGDEGCGDSVDVCCTIPTSSTEAPTPKPKETVQNATKPKGCGFRNSNGIGFTIVGEKKGSASQFGEFPWVVALLDVFDDSYAGVGVLIHPQVVLTTAHIASKYHPEGLKIRAGEWDTKTIKEPHSHQERYLQEIYIHPVFNTRTLANDIAILHLEKPLELADHINTICLAEEGEILDDHKNCIANGWGKDRFGKNVDFAVVLKMVEVDMVEHSHCNDLLKFTRLGTRYKLHSSFVCAGGEEGKDTCTGDGGGPLACPMGNGRYKLAGLVAGGVGCGKKNVPGLYSSLPALRSWVDERMNTLGYGTSYYTV